MRDSGLARLAADVGADAMVHVLGDAFEHVAHRVVGHGGEVHDGIDTLQQALGDVTHVPEVLLVERPFRQNERAARRQREEGAVVAGEVASGCMRGRCRATIGPT